MTDTLLTRLPPTERGLALADTYCVTDIETTADSVMLDGQRWYDTRPMLDPREHCDEFIDLAKATIDHVLSRGLAVRHLQQPHLVRLTPKALG